jgi:hypothetical protein
MARQPLPAAFAIPAAPQCQLLLAALTHPFSLAELHLLSREAAQQDRGEEQSWILGFLARQVSRLLWSEIHLLKLIPSVTALGNVAFGRYLSLRVAPS